MGKRNTSAQNTRSARPASQNARRHGVTAPVPVAETRSIYREIFENPLRVSASYATHEVDRLAWAFAEGEAQVARAIEAERAHLFGRSAEASPAGERATSGDGAGAEMLDVEALREIVQSEGADVAGRVSAARETAFWRKAGLLQRYRREAETRRRRALRLYARALVADEPVPPAAPAAPDCTEQGGPRHAARVAPDGGCHGRGPPGRGPGPFFDIDGPACPHGDAPPRRGDMLSRGPV